MLLVSMISGEGSSPDLRSELMNLIKSEYSEGISGAASENSFKTAKELLADFNFEEHKAEAQQIEEQHSETSDDEPLRRMSSRHKPVMHKM